MTYWLLLRLVIALLRESLYSGFPEYTGDAALRPITSNPRTPQVADEYGNQTLYGTTDNADANFPIDSRIVEFIEYGVLNGSFGRGPQVDPYHDITDINPLPDWTGPTSVSGGAITAQWVTDAASPSGYSLRFTVNPGAASDEAYFEQIVPIGGTRSQIAADAIRFSAYRVTATNNGFQAYCTMRYLDTSLSVLGTGDKTAAVAFTANGQLKFSSALNDEAFLATARYIRVRIGVKRNTAAASDSGTFDFSDVRRDPGQGYLLLADNSLPTTKLAAQVYATGGTLSLIPSNGGSGLSIYLDSIQPPGFVIIPETAAPSVASGNFQIYAKTSDHLFYGKDGSGTEYQLSLVDTATGALTLPTSGTGVGIAFPATAVPSAGANTLDDYEEGTFTPAMAYATVGTSSWVVTTQTGFYTKIGNRVLIHGTYQGVPTNGSGAGNLQMTGLPFTSNTTAGSGARAGVEFQGHNATNSYTQITGNIAANGTTMTFRGSKAATSTATLAVADITSGSTVIAAYYGHYFV